MAKNFLDLSGLTEYDGYLKEYIQSHSGGGNTDIIAADYDSTATYAVGDYCIYNNTLYRCTTAITTAEAWNSSHWTSTNVDSELDLKMTKANPTGTGSFSMNRKANTTIGAYSTTEGRECTASGSGSHAEGFETTASGSYSHAQGLYARASHKSQFAFGEYNVLDNSSNAASARGNYVEIVGNGTSDSTRSNARTLDWSGNMWLAGTLTAVDQPQEKISSTEPSGQNNGDYWLQAYTP